MKVHVSKGGMSTLLNQLSLTKKKQGPMDMQLFTLKLKKVHVLRGMASIIVGVVSSLLEGVRCIKACINIALCIVSVE